MKGLDTMEQVIIIRQARPEDRKKIWDILHANCQTWTLHQIIDNLGEMFVLAKDDKMLGVLSGSFNLGVKKIYWVEIHPFYPEKALRDVMAQGLLGTLQPDVEVKLLQKAEGYHDEG
jgi:hypothetical protein